MVVSLVARQPLPHPAFQCHPFLPPPPSSPPFSRMDARETVRLELELLEEPAFRCHAPRRKRYQRARLEAAYRGANGKDE